MSTNTASDASTNNATADESLMYRPPENNNDRQDVSLGDIIDRIKAGFGSFSGSGDGNSGGSSGSNGSSTSSSSEPRRRRIPVGAIIAIIIVAIGAWLATGIYTVGPEEQAALRTFGRFQGIADQGLHWHWPSPIGVRNVVAVTNTRRLELGFRSSGEGSSATPVFGESQMITGDENLVDVQVVVQYRISNLRNFLFEVDDPGDVDRGISVGSPEGATLRDMAETAVRQVVGARNIDDVLTTEKEQVQTDVQLKMRELAAAYTTGLDILQVLLQNVNPPSAVQDAFDDVVRAREDRERDINLAEAYKAAEIPRAEGTSAQIIQEAEGFKRGRIARAQGEADGFNAILAGYQQSQEVTRTRLYLEALETLLAGKSKVILPSGSDALPLLPLDSLSALTGDSPLSGSTSGSASTTTSGN